MHAVQVVSNANIYNFYPPPQKNILFSRPLKSAILFDNQYISGNIAC